ncbi:MAG TPA: ATPase, T2SS/T4P/T4SS family [Oscillatoriaceae cyanobacterium]
MAVGGKRIRLGEILIKAGVLEEAQLEEALAKQKETREPIGEILTKMGFVTEEKIKYALELQFGVKHINLKQARVPAEILKLLPEQIMKQFMMIPVQVNQLTVALVDPNNILAIDEIRKRLRGVNVVPAVCTESDFWELLKTVPKEGPAPTAEAKPAASSHLPEIPTATDAQLKELIDRAAKGGGEAAVTPLVNAILAAAIKKRASSVLIEPMEHEVILRYRVDGHMLREPGIPGKLGPAIASRVKVMAGLSVTSGNTPQSGVFSFNFENRPVKIAFHSLPARYGHMVTIRIFDSAILASQGVDNLVLSQRVAASLRTLLAKPSGMVLFAGPRGAGKTILMYACLKEMQTQGASVITVEDPIEFDLDGITQVPVSHEPGANDLSVTAGLNSAFNQSPSVLMMGDIDTPEVAQRLVRGALSGTLLMAGLTTTQAALVEARETWDVPGRLIANAITGLVTQRLVRRLCPSCKQKYMPDERTAKFFARLNNSGELYKSVGCDTCYQTGFSGQVGVYEVIPFTPQIRELVARNAPKAHIDQLARQMGLLTLEDYAMWLVSQGYTTLEEIKKTDIHELVQAGQMAQEAAAIVPGGQAAAAV